MRLKQSECGQGGECKRGAVDGILALARRDYVGSLSANQKAYLLRYHLCESASFVRMTSCQANRLIRRHRGRRFMRAFVIAMMLALAGFVGWDTRHLWWSGKAVVERTIVPPAKATYRLDDSAWRTWLVGDFELVILARALGNRDRTLLKRQLSLFQNLVAPVGENDWQLEFSKLQADFPHADEVVYYSPRYAGRGGVYVSGGGGVTAVAGRGGYSGTRAEAWTDGNRSYARAGGGTSGSSSVYLRNSVRSVNQDVFSRYQSSFRQLRFDNFSEQIKTLRQRQERDVRDLRSQVGGASSLAAQRQATLNWLSGSIDEYLNDWEYLAQAMESTLRKREERLADWLEFEEKHGMSLQATIRSLEDRRLPGCGVIELNSGEVDRLLVHGRFGSRTLYFPLAESGDGVRLVQVSP